LEENEHMTKIQWERAKDFQRILSNLGVHASKNLQFESYTTSEKKEEISSYKPFKLSKEANPKISKMSRFSRSEKKVKPFSNGYLRKNAFDYQEFEKRLNRKLKNHNIKI
jgi:hypothetical protein